MIRPEVYQENGYADRADYLNCLSEDYGIPAGAIIAMAEVLGPDEDFDGLVSNLEDAMYGGWFDENNAEEDEDEQLADATGG